MTDEPTPGTTSDDDELLPSGEKPLGERPPATEGEDLNTPKTEDDGTPVTPSGGRSAQSS
jgi:hypothetical protein